ncbi:MAG: GTP cyclohydrolase I [Myxococcales bacterium]|nr:GTP cyclohydrolase I [Myxococcales bacterium]
MTDAERHAEALLAAIGFAGDPEMAGTARRFAALLGEFVPAPLEPLSVCATTQPGPVVVRAIPFHSLCAHHLLPFSGQVSVGYVPDATLLGLGSIPRLVGALARRPQLQERLGEQIADEIERAAQPLSVVVEVRARHLCVEMRGSRTPAQVVTLARRGADHPWLLARVSEG